MRIPNSYYDMANAGLGVKDAMSLACAVKKFSPAHSRAVPRQLLAQFTKRGLLAFVGNPSVAFISGRVAREAIPEFYGQRRDGDAQSSAQPGNAHEGVRQDLAKVRSDLLEEIAKLRKSVEQARADIDALRNAQIAERTRRESDHGALVEMLAEMQKEVSELKNALGTEKGGAK